MKPHEQRHDGYACRNAVAPLCVQRVAPNSRRILRWIPRIRAASTCEAARRSALMLSVLSIALKFASAGSSTACHHFASPRHGGTTRNIGKCECAGSAAKIRAEEKCCRPRRAACHDLFGEDDRKGPCTAQCSGRLSDLRVCLFALAKNLDSSAISRTRGKDPSPAEPQWAAFGGTSIRPPLQLKRGQASYDLSDLRGRKRRR